MGGRAGKHHGSGATERPGFYRDTRAALRAGLRAALRAGPEAAGRASRRANLTAGLSGRRTDDLGLHRLAERVGRPSC